MPQPRRLDRTLRGQAASPGRERTRRRAILRALRDLATVQHGIVERGQLLDIGFSPDQIDRMVAAGHLTVIHRGVYAVGHSALTRHGRSLAAVMAVGGVSGLSKRSAAGHRDLWQFPSGHVDVLLAGCGSRRIPGINIHRSRAFGLAHLTVHEGVPVTSVAWTLVELAGSIGHVALRKCYDVADRRCLIDFDELAYLLHHGSGRRGIGKIRSLAALDRSQSRRTRSMLELEFLAFCREEQLPEPLINHVLGGFEVDACWPAASLVVELDSWEWHADRESFERDRAKASDLQAVGMNVVAVTDRRLKRERATVAETLRALLDRGDATSLRITRSSRITWSG